MAIKQQISIYEVHKSIVDCFPKTPCYMDIILDSDIFFEFRKHIHILYLKDYVYASLVNKEK